MKGQRDTVLTMAEQLSPLRYNAGIIGIPKVHHLDASTSPAVIAEATEQTIMHHLELVFSITVHRPR